MEKRLLCDKVIEMMKNCAIIVQTTIDFTAREGVRGMSTTVQESTTQVDSNRLMQSSDYQTDAVKTKKGKLRCTRLKVG